MSKAAEDLSRFKPKVEPTSSLLAPLYDDLVLAKSLIDCAYLATLGVHPIRGGDGDSLRAALDEGISKLERVRQAMHDMIAWVDSNSSATTKSPRNAIV